MDSSVQHHDGWFSSYRGWIIQRTGDEYEFYNNDHRGLVSSPEEARDSIDCVQDGEWEDFKFRIGERIRRMGMDLDSLREAEEILRRMEIESNPRHGMGARIAFLVILGVLVILRISC